MYLNIISSAAGLDKVDLTETYDVFKLKLLIHEIIGIKK